MLFLHAQRQVGQVESDLSDSILSVTFISARYSSSQQCHRVHAIYKKIDLSWSFIGKQILPKWSERGDSCRYNPRPYLAAWWCILRTCFRFEMELVICAPQ